MGKPLWAPWRMDYIRSAVKNCRTDRKACLFCRLLRSKDDGENLVLHRTALALVVMNRYPYNNGHLMVAPKRHLADYEKLKPEEGAELQRLVQLSLRALRLEMQPQGYNIGLNQGKVAGAGVAGHLHVHIVPRWLGDVNYMAAVADTVVISEHLKETYHRLHKHYSRKH